MFAQSVINISILRKAVKKNELFICETTWMNLQGIILSQKKKKKNKTVSEDCILHDLFDLYKIFKDEILEIKNRLVLPRS